MIKDKKVLVVTTTDNMIWQFLLPHIEDLTKNGNVVECACAETGFWFKELEDKYNLTMRKIDFPRSPLSTKTLKSRKQLLKLVKENKYDLIYCHQPVGGVMGRMAGHKYKIPVIYVAHGFHFFKGCPKKNLLYKIIEKHYSKYTDALVTMNDEDYQSALTFKAKNVYKINGIGFDASKYTRSDKDYSSLEKELGIEEGDIAFLSIGELNENKNHLVVLNAMNEIKDNEHIKYFICGQGPRKEEYENYIQQNGLQDKIKLLGFRKDIADLLNVMDVFIMPSLREGLPRSIMESMAYGMPCIVSNIRGCRDLVDNEKGGFLVEPSNVSQYAEKIMKLASDDSMRKEMGGYNKVKIQDYTTDVVLEQMKKIYGEVVK